MLDSKTMKRISILHCALLAGLCLLFLIATSMSQSTNTPSLPIDEGSQIQLARDTSDINTLCYLLSSKSAEVQFTALRRLGKMKDKQAAPRILDYLAAINFIVEGSEEATAHLHLKQLAVAAFESNSGQQFGAFELYKLSEDEIEEYIERARKKLGETIPTNKTHTEEAKAPSLPPPTVPPTLKKTPDLLPAAPSEEPASSTPWGIIAGVIVAVCGLVWVLRKQSGKQ